MPVCRHAPTRRRREAQRSLARPADATAPSGRPPDLCRPAPGRAGPAGADRVRLPAGARRLRRLADVPVVAGDRRPGPGDPSRGPAPRPRRRRHPPGLKVPAPPRRQHVPQSSVIIAARCTVGAVAYTVPHAALIPRMSTLQQALFDNGFHFAEAGGVRSAAALSLVAPLSLLVLCGCTPSSADDGRVRVLAAAYPFAWAAQQVGGPDVHVQDLVRAGAEPHDVELSPRQVGAFEQASVIVYLRGFQPAVDDAIREAPRAARLDLTPVVDVRPFSSDLTGDKESGVDPHVWLDPVRMQAVVRAVADRLATQDRKHATAYAARAAATVARLT